MARAAEQFRSLGEKQAKRLMVAGAGGGKLREVVTQLEQVRDLLGGVDDGSSSPAAAESFYGIDDLLDEMEYHRIAFHLEASPNTNPKVSNPLASALRLGRRFLSSSSISSDGQASRSRWFLKDLDSVATSLASLLNQVRGSSLPLAISDAPPEDNKVFGRTRELNDIVQMLTEPMSSHQPTLKVISIVGFAGLGKTTLAQSVYDHIRVQRHFDLTAWAHVSAKPDRLELANQILRSASPAYRGSIDKDATFGALQSQLTQLLASKRFLLVLDDVWDVAQDTWQELLIPLKSAQSGSRIIVTTRTPKVADMLGASHTYHLNPLGIEDCWSLFHRYAFGGWSTHDSSDELEQIGRVIVAKVHGLPLAVKVLAGLLGATKSTKYWRIISEKQFSGDATLSSLRLSYSYLPGRLKQCFAFCSIFPRNWKFDQRTMIRLWMANGFIQSQTDTGKRMEDLGTDYFNALLSRSFFQTLRQGPRTHCIMHDLIHDLAVSVSTNDCFQIEPGMTRSIPSTVRHISVITDGIQDINAAINMLPKKLRTLLVLRTRSFSSYCLQGDFLAKLKTLRVLDISHSDYTELPRSISCLIHLRYLSLCRTIRSLPECRLVKLRHLGIDMKYIAQVPGIGRLINLQGSVEFCVKKGGGHALQELNGINGLHGQLKIKGLDNVLSKDEATKTNMKRKENLRALRLEWSSASRIRTPVTDYQVLENLQPHQNLKELHIVRYLGATAPSWLQYAALRELQSLHLVNCRSLGVLPPLGLLPSLQQLHMKELCTVKRIGHEFYGTVDLSFPSLKVLVFDDFPSLVEWSEVRADPFPCLQKLEIVDCPKLIQVPAFPQSVSELTVERTLLISNMRLAPYSSSRLEILTLSVSTTSVLCRGLFHQSHLESIVVLNINAGCKQLVSAEGLHTFTSLQKLQLCHSDISDQNLGSLLQLSSIVSLGTFVSLKRLVIEKCPKLTAASFPISTHPYCFVEMWKSNDAPSIPQCSVYRLFEKSKFANLDQGVQGILYFLKPRQKAQQLSPSKGTTKWITLAMIHAGPPPLDVLLGTPLVHLKYISVMGTRINISEN
ncbi:Putative disease resistance RPP13-like protein 1 [Triticum urartu]|uniref:Putative disease resistance RPP13-like protein 1 n=1 Tax=Triticum urartu TaxID=4572 RepID=M7YWY0_TRIUA|nr:Putative disease resistance RPP13-like protein 1 [Triticum urartu]